MSLYVDIHGIYKNIYFKSLKFKILIPGRRIWLVQLKWDVFYSFLCKRKDWQGVKLPSVLTTTEPVLRDKYSKRQCENRKKTIGNSKIKKIMTRVVIDLLATWTMTDTLNWHEIFHGKADRESAALRTDSEYYKRTQSIIRYRSKQMFKVEKKVEQYYWEWSRR